MRRQVTNGSRLLHSVSGELEQWLHDAEESLLQPKIRRSADRVAALLAIFRRMEYVPMEMQAFRTVEISSDTVLVTCRCTQADGDGSPLRSSLWKQIKGSW